MLQKFRFLIITAISYSVYAMDLQDAQMLAQGHSEDGYVNLERVGQISKALTIIRGKYPELSDIHAASQFNIEVAIPADAAEEVFLHVDQITKKFDGQHLELEIEEIPQVWSNGQSPNKYVDIKFNNNVDIPALIKRYKQVQGVRSVCPLGLNGELDLTDIQLQDKSPEWLFIFRKPNTLLYEISFNTVNLSCQKK